MGNKTVDIDAAITRAHDAFHAWSEPIASGAGHARHDGTVRSVSWTGHTCLRCGVTIKRDVDTREVIAWASSFLGDWAEDDAPLPACVEG